MTKSARGFAPTRRKDYDDGAIVITPTFCENSSPASQGPAAFFPYETIFMDSRFKKASCTIYASCMLGDHVFEASKLRTLSHIRER